jgi:hypothetical protein
VRRLRAVAAHGTSTGGDANELHIVHSMAMRWCALWPTLALALTIWTTPVVVQQPTLPTLTQPINDFAGIIDAASACVLNERISALRAAGGARGAASSGWSSGRGTNTTSSRDGSASGSW